MTSYGVKQERFGVPAQSA